MGADSIINLSLWVLGVWLVVVVVHAVYLARDKKWNPLPAESPEHHGDHGHGAPGHH